MIFWGKIQRERERRQGEGGRGGGRALISRGKYAILIFRLFEGGPGEKFTRNPLRSRLLADSGLRSVLYGLDRSRGGLSRTADGALPPDFDFFILTFLIAGLYSLVRFILRIFIRGGRWGGPPAHALFFSAP